MSERFSMPVRNAITGEHFDNIADAIRCRHHRHGQSGATVCRGALALRIYRLASGAMRGRSV